MVLPDIVVFDIVLQLILKVILYFEATNSNRVKSMLAQLTALLGRIGYLSGDEKGRDFLEFIVRLCALPSQDGDEVSPTISFLIPSCSRWLSGLKQARASTLFPWTWVPLPAHRHASSN